MLNADITTPAKAQSRLLSPAYNPWRSWQVALVVIAALPFLLYACEPLLSPTKGPSWFGRLLGTNLRHSLPLICLLAHLGLRRRRLLISLGLTAFLFVISGLGAYMQTNFDDELSRELIVKKTIHGLSIAIPCVLIAEGAKILRFGNALVLSAIGLLAVDALQSLSWEKHKLDANAPFSQQNIMLALAAVGAIALVFIVLRYRRLVLEARARGIAVKATKEVA